ncbi:tetratricopeptide repeat protein [Rhodoferax mekongensis]|uniref:tetratricopeptide repeat protein n=1 Tax=Rhodoferax mekongensis TaxID=3068341 RepID=UPI0028BDCC39|nr:tetratricopeptide repeat protein [Rhodoferax sp. TBRC 17199]MDT7515276.1 tetratricopeptide repeat protein [Rhodoferax sp. TBRC 17199]
MSPAAWSAVIGADPPSAALWMRQASELGSADAQLVMGQWLLDGHGTGANHAEAIGYFLKSGIQGHAMGMNMCGRCFENGWGTAVDFFAAANWFRQAAHKGLDAGMYNYANLLATGKGVKKNDDEALQWYTTAARLGHAKSMTKIGHFHEDGRVVVKDAEAALAWFRKGAEGGDFRGQFNYASMLAERGRQEEAMFWLEKVPLTATAAYKRLVGDKLLNSPHASFQAVGRAMLAGAMSV